MGRFRNVDGRKLPVYPDRPDYVALEGGESYDLVQRAPME